MYKKNGKIQKMGAHILYDVGISTSRKYQMFYTK